MEKEISRISYFTIVEQINLKNNNKKTQIKTLKLQVITLVFLFLLQISVNQSVLVLLIHAVYHYFSFVIINNSDYGVRETTVKVGHKFITVKEKIPDIIVPDLDNFDVSFLYYRLVVRKYNNYIYIFFVYFQLKPYVSYRVPEVTQSEFTAKDLFNAVYRTKILNDFKNKKLSTIGQPIEPSPEELLTPEQAKIKARQTGSDLFSQGIQK